MSEPQNAKCKTLSLQPISHKLRFQPVPGPPSIYIACNVYVLLSTPYTSVSTSLHTGIREIELVERAQDAIDRAPFPNAAL